MCSALVRLFSSNCWFRSLLRPGEVAVVVILHPHEPSVQRDAASADADVALRGDLLGALVAPEDVRSGIRGVLENVEHAVVVQPAPNESAVPRPAVGSFREPPDLAWGVPVPFRMTSRDDLAESGRPPGAPGGPMCSEHLKRTCAPAVQPPMDAPWGVCAVERQYRDRQASGRARSIRQTGGST